MVLGVLQLSIRLPEAQSLKEKRWPLKSLLTRIRNKFNVSIAEVGGQDSWQIATVAAAHVGTSRAHTNEVLDKVADFARGMRQIEVIDTQLEFF